MSSESLLPVICKYPHHALLSSHILLLILWRPEAKGKNQTVQVQQETFDESFFSRVALQVYGTSKSLEQEFNKRLEIYKLETGSLAPHHAYFRSIALALVLILYEQEEETETVARAVLLDEFLSYLEDEGLTDTSRSCPIELVHLLTLLAGRDSSRSLYDPRCATGRLLAGLVNNVGTDLTGYVRGFGQSLNEADIFHAKLRALSTSDELLFEEADPFLLPEYSSGQLRKFDIAVSDLSNGVDMWPQGFGDLDPVRRFRFGLPSRTKGEFALVQHMLSTIQAPKGIGMVIVDHSVLLRSGRDAEIRKAFIENNILDTVIFLPQKLFRSDARRLAILVFKVWRTDTDVLVINGSTDFESSKSLNKLTAAGIQKIFEKFVSRTPVANEALLLSPEEFRLNDYAVSLGRYFPARRETPDLDLHNLSHAREAIGNELFETGRTIDSLISSLIIRS